MRRILTAIAASVLLVVAGCGGGAAPRPADGLTLAVARIAATLDPAESLTTSYLRAYGVGESLAKIQPDGTVAPELAESIEQTAPDTWTVVLREGATFHSGAPADAEAVRASLERSAAENELAGDLMQGLTVSVVDARTLTVRSDSPAPFLDHTLAHYELQIHNAAGYRGLSAPAGPADVDLTGPFRVTGFSPERELTLERNDAWWGPAPSIRTITVQ
ncbi:MAG: ABC transporter substrate-binding protein, partial [Actinomycetes bacterium]